MKKGKAIEVSSPGEVGEAGDSEAEPVKSSPAQKAAIDGLDEDGRYLLDQVVAADKPGILFQLADFFDRQGITIENLQSTRYRAMQTGAEMFSAQVTIGVPANMHIAALRDDFLEFCDHLNLDAIMDPMKF